MRYVLLKSASSTVFTNIGTKYPNEWAASILALVAMAVTSPIYYFYYNGERIRKNSKFAARIAQQREEDAADGEKKGQGGERRVEDIEDDAAAPEFGTSAEKGRRLGRH